MLNFILTNLSTIIDSLILLAVVSRVVYKQVKAKKNGQSSCSACSGCAAAPLCSSQEKIVAK